MKKTGFIGIGVMGSSMVKNLLKSGFEVAVYTRTKEKAESVIKEGALWCDTVKDCARNKDVVITIVGYPRDVEEVYLRVSPFFLTYSNLSMYFSSSFCMV